MSLDKAIKSGKEHRKEYRGAKSVDPSCRNHGSCLFCEKAKLKISFSIYIFIYKNYKISPAIFYRGIIVTSI